MAIDHERWHDGIGYDMEALAALDAAGRAAIEAELIPRAAQDWRDVEALAALGTPAAIDALLEAFDSGDRRIEAAVRRYAPSLVSEAKRVRSLVKAIRNAGLCDGLSDAIEEAADFHPPQVCRALQRALLEREDEAAVLIAGLLFYIHGKADEPFDWKQRPFFLRFGTKERVERETAYRELCATLGLPPLPER